MKAIIRLLILLSLTSSVYSKILTMNNGMIEPVELLNYPLDRFLKEYSEATKTLIAYDTELLKKNEKISLILRKKISAHDAEQYLIKLLYNKGLAVVKDSCGLSIIRSRDLMYTPTQVYKSENFPITNEFISVFHRMKYPLAESINRKLRPFLSRDGRLIIFKDNRNILIKDSGSNSRQILNIIKILDTGESFQRYLSEKREKAQNLSKKSPKEKSIDELNKKIEEIEQMAKGHSKKNK